MQNEQPDAARIDSLKKEIDSLRILLRECTNKRYAESDAERGMMILTLQEIVEAKADGQPWITLASIQNLARNALAALAKNEESEN